MKYHICTNCVMDTSDPEINFDKDGVCNHCRSYEARKKMFVPSQVEKLKYLNKMVDFCKRKGKDKKYDCIIGVSGGVDSTFVAFKIKELGLRPLAIHLDNGWDAELAVSNIRNVLKILDIELYTYVQFHEKLFSSDALGGSVYSQYAQELDLDMNTCEACITERRYQEAVQADLDFAVNLGVRSTPTFFINGLAIVGAQPLDIFKQVIDKELAGEIP